MDRGVISLKFAMLRHSDRKLRALGWVVGAVLVMTTWIAAAVAAGDSVRHTVLTLTFAAWFVGALVGPVLMSGAGVLRAEYFALLPVRAADLGRALLASVFAGVAAGYVLMALFASIWHAAALDPWTIGIAVIGSVLTWVLIITASRLVYGALGAAMRTRLGIEIAGVQWGIILATMFAGWIVVLVGIQSIPALLRDGLPPSMITVVLDAFPTSWTVVAVEAAARGDWGGASLLLLGLLALDVVLVAVTVALLVPRATRSSRGRGRPRSAGLVAGRGVLPSGPTGAVVMKELRQWRRDPWRALESSTAVWTGAAIGVFALLGGWTAPAAAFAGVIVAFMVSLSGCNLYGQDGSAVWQNVVGERAGSVSADVRGRQWALVVVFLPRAVIVSAVFLVLSQAWWAVPYVLAALGATLGAAVGTGVLVSAIGVSPGVDPRRRVGPNDANGNIVLQVWIALVATQICVVPTAGMVLWAALSASSWVLIVTVVIGLLNGLVAVWMLGSLTIAYLDTRMVDVFGRIRYGRMFRDPGNSVLDQLAIATLKSDQHAALHKQRERARRVARDSSR